MDTPTPGSRRKVDIPSVLLLVTGLVSGAMSCWLIYTHHLTPLAAIPAVVAIAIGATHLTKREAPHPPEDTP